MALFYTTKLLSAYFYISRPNFSSVVAPCTSLSGCRRLLIEPYFDVLPVRYGMRVVAFLTFDMATSHLIGFQAIDVS